MCQNGNKIVISPVNSVTLQVFAESRIRMENILSSKIIEKFVSVKILNYQRKY